MPTSTLLERVAQYQQMTDAAIDDLCERFPAADVMDVRLPSAQPSAKDGVSAKQLLRLPAAARASSEAWVRELATFSSQVLAEFQADSLRALRPPTLHLDVLHASLHFNNATAVEKLDREQLDRSTSACRLALPSLPASEQARITAQLRALSAVDPTTLRTIRASGSAYVLRSITADNQSLRANVNHLIMLVSACDDLPAVLWARPRRRRNDIKQRVPILDFPGGSYRTNGENHTVQPIRIYQL